MAKVKKYGDWDKLSDWKKYIKSDKPLKKIVNKMDNLGKTVRDALKNHIKSNDLPWKKLSPITVRIKGNNKIYIDHGTYMNKIIHSVRPTKDNGLIVVITTRGNHYSGLSANELAKILEYGTSKTPARPLWRPTFEEMKKMKEFEDFIDIGAIFSFKGTD